MTEKTKECVADKDSATKRVMASFLRPSWRTTVCRSILLSSRDGRTYATTTPTGTQDPLGYCLQLVQKQDYEGFLSYPFYPKAAQPGYLALKAFQARQTICLSTLCIDNMRRSSSPLFMIRYPIR
jgi:hypothetical protein